MVPEKRTSDVMKKILFVLSMVAIGLSPMARADEAKAPERPSREEVRNQFKDLSPEERAARWQELREKHGLSERRAPGPGAGAIPPAERRAQLDKFQEATPEERRARIEELRRRSQPQQGEARLQEFRQRAERHLADLRKKEQEGALTEREKQQLERMEEHFKRMESQPPRLDANPQRGPRAFTQRPRAGTPRDDKDQ
jgi:hypothetical protein